MKIAIIDDSEPEALFLKEIIEEKQLQCSLYTCISDRTLQSFFRFPPDLFFLDLFLPGMNGFDVCKRLKQHEETKTIPVIIITASVDQAHLTKAFDAGADDFITKPLYRHEIIARLNAQLRNQKLFKDLSFANKQYEQKVEEYRQINVQLLETLETLSYNELKLDVMLNESQDAALFLQNNAITDCNESFLKLFQFQAKELLVGRNFLGFTPEFQSDGSLSTVKMNEVLKEIEIYDKAEFPWVFNKNNGQLLYSWVNIQRISPSLLYVKIKEKFNTLYPAFTVDGHKQIFEKVFNSVSSIIFILDQNCNVMLMNRYGTELSGIQTESPIGKKPGNAMNCISALKSTNGCGFGLECKDCVIQNSYKNTLVYERESSKQEAYLTLCIDQKPVPVYTLLSTILIKDMGNKYCIVILDDISEKKQAEINLKETNKSLLMASQQKDWLLSIISHDLRSKITAMTSAIGLLDLHYRNNKADNTLSYINLLKSSQESALQMLDELLHWGKMVTNNMQYHFKPFNPIAVIKQTKEYLSESLVEKQISLKIKHPKDLILNGDTTMFGVLVRNLISNAIKFSHPGSKIEISGTILPLDHDKKQIHSVIQYCVEDHGIGMEQDTLEKLFTLAIGNRFVRGTSGEKGTGLGLLICKEIVENMGGKIWAESEPGKGSCLYFVLPNKYEQIKN